MKKLLWAILLSSMAFGADGVVTKRLSELSGNNLSEKYASANASCAAGDTCIFIIDGNIPKFSGENLPAPCATCTFIDERIQNDPPGGAQGPAGPQGIQGPQGDVGPQGIQGIQGPAGADGAQGPQGIQGVKGDTGAQGIQGPAGNDGATGAPGTPGTGSARRVAANVANSTTSFSDITGLTWTAVSGTSYSFQCSIYFSSAITTTGIGLAINGPAASLIRYNAIIPTTATAQSSFPATTYDATTTLGTAALTTVLEARVTGTVTPSANGTLAIRFRSEVAASAVTVQAGSFCEVL